MTDFVTIKRNFESEKERIQELNNVVKNKLETTIKEIDSALSIIEQTRNQFQELDNTLNEKKREEIQLQNEKKGLLNDISSLKENIERIKLSKQGEEEKITELEKEKSQLITELETTKNELAKTESAISQMKEKIKAKTQEKSDTKSNMENRIKQVQQTLTTLEKEEQNDIQVSPILDFLLKEVRIDIPEVEILSVLAYKNQAIGLDELKKAVSKTPPVIILKVIRNLDSKGIIKYDERLDTIEITANLL